MKYGLFSGVAVGALFGYAISEIVSGMRGSESTISVPSRVQWRELASSTAGVVQLRGRWLASCDAILEPETSGERWMRGLPPCGGDVPQAPTSALNTMEIAWIKMFQGGDVDFTVEVGAGNEGGAVEVNRLIDCSVAGGLPTTLPELIAQSETFHDFVIEVTGVVGAGVSGLYLYPNMEALQSRKVDLGIGIENRSFGVPLDNWDLFDVPRASRIVGLYRRPWKDDGMAPNGAFSVLYRIDPVQ